MLFHLAFFSGMGGNISHVGFSNIFFSATTVISLFLPLLIYILPTSTLNFSKHCQICSFVPHLFSLCLFVSLYTHTKSIVFISFLLYFPFFILLFHSLQVPLFLSYNYLVFYEPFLRAILNIRLMFDFSLFISRCYFCLS